jgi:sulfur carrier protein ThiS adenylyltransferase
MSVATENVSYVRQSAILDPARAAEVKVMVVGCGTVGSNAAVQLAKAGFKQFALSDMDAVEAHNIPSQDFRIDDLGSQKTGAVKQAIQRVAEETTVQVIGEWDKFMPVLGDVVISAADSMDVRRDLFESVRGNSAVSLLIDFRMGGNELQVRAFDPNDERRCAQYEDTLHDAADSVPAECGGRTFAPVGALAGALATQFLTKHLRDGDGPPFYLLVDFDNFAMTAIGLPERES